MHRWIDIEKTLPRHKRVAGYEYCTSETHTTRVSKTCAIQLIAIYLPRLNSKVFLALLLLSQLEFLVGYKNVFFFFFPDRRTANPLWTRARKPSCHNLGNNSHIRSDACLLTNIATKTK